MTKTTLSEVVVLVTMLILFSCIVDDTLESSCWGKGSIPYPLVIQSFTYPREYYRDFEHLQGGIRRILEYEFEGQ